MPVGFMNINSLIRHPTANWDS